MPPKKVQEPERKPMIGRVGTNLKVGIVGVPNVGKSTFFNVLTKSQAAAENFPFCTIDPNENKQMSVCNIKPNISNFYIPDNAFDDVKISQSVIINVRNLKHIVGVRLDDDKTENTAEEIYPACNSYYSHLEDCDALGKVNSLLVEPELLEQAREAEPTYKDEPYSKREAQQRYLESKPVSFIILGKPDIGQQQLGKNLVDLWGCLYIEPQTLIEEALKAATDLGRSMEFNLRLGRAVGIDVILDLVQRKAKSQRAKHRGFVICGLPLIPNDLYEEDPKSTASAIFTARSICEEVLDNVESQIPEESRTSFSTGYSGSEQTRSESDSKKTSTPSSAKESLAEINRAQSNLVSVPSKDNKFADVCIGLDYEKQLNFIFGLLEFPFIILYIQCGSIDVLNIRDSYRFDVNSKTTINLQEVTYNKASIHDMFELMEDDFRRKDLVKLPGNFRANVSCQLDYYHYTALRFVQNRIIAHKPEYFIKVDGRSGLYKMFNIVKAKLDTLNLQRVLEVVKLSDKDMTVYFQTDDTLLAEDSDNERRDEDTPKLTPEECFKQFRTKNSPSKQYLWSWSEWRALCPVLMKNGFIAEGSAEFCVQFMDHIFFLSSEQAFVKFHENPRPYLMSPFPRPTCRVFIFGPRRSGRSALANCLSYYFGGSVLQTEKLMNEFMNQRESEFLANLRRKATAAGIAELNAIRKAEAEELEKQRVEDIKEWAKTVLGILEEIKEALEEMEEEGKRTTLQISSFPMAMSKANTEEMFLDSEYSEKIYELKMKLEDINFPIFKIDTETWLTFLTDRKKVLNYVPAKYSHKIRAQAATMYDDYVKDFVARAIANAGINSAEINEESLLQLFVKEMDAAEVSYKKQGFNRGGWIVDGMLCNLPLIKDLFPDNTADDIIVLYDSSDTLVKNFESNESTYFNDYRQFFEKIGKDDALERSPSLTSTREERERMVGSILTEEILERDEFYGQDRDKEGDTRGVSRIGDYRNDLMVFKRDWDKIRKFYTDNQITPIEIDVAGKTLPELFEIAIDCLDRFNFKASRTYDKLEQGKQEDESETDDTRTTASEPSSNSKPESNEETFKIYGNTSHFCPVTFSKDFVLWKGREDLAVTYDDTIYLLATESCMNMFLQNTRKLFPPEYPLRFPPPRICVVGVSGSGRTQMSRAISENYGLVHISYEDFLKASYSINTKFSLEKIRTRPDTSGLKNYLNGNEKLPDNVAMKILTYWFEEPFKSVGFVFDDFPKTYHDVEFMVDNKMIPDAVLYLQESENYLRRKFMEQRLKAWRESIEQEKKLLEVKHKHEIEVWKEQRSIRYNILLEERREKRYAEAKEGQRTETGSLSTSMISIDSVADQEDQDEINRILDEEVPPIFKDLLEADPPEAFIAQLEPEIVECVQTHLAIINAVRQKCQENRINFVPVKLDLDVPERTKASCFLKCEPIKFRNRSLFESCYDISLDLAESMLKCGYKFLSKFGKTCPIQYYHNETPIQLYQGALDTEELFAVLHRSYIYYIVGEGNKERFKNDPIKYISQEFKFPLIAYRAAVTGAPKSGKTLLASRIGKELGLKVITRGEAVRYVLSHLFQSDLAKNIEAVLRNGWELTDEMVIRSVEAFSFDARGSVQGLVFDGFPVSTQEVKHLAYLNLLPSIVINLSANQEQVLECLDNDYYRGLLRFSSKLINYRHSVWTMESDYFNGWFDKEYQAMTTIPIDTSTWSVWDQSKKYILSTFCEINHYNKHIMDDWPLRLGNMLVTPLEFLERQSSFRTFCLCCLDNSNTLNNGGEPPDRTGAVHFRKYFYWLCNDHIEQFLRKPERYLPPFNKNKFPENMPKRVYLETIPTDVYEDGMCPVCYKTKRFVTGGCLEFAVEYGEKIYLFDTLQCLTLFLSKPHKYLAIIDFEFPSYPDLNYKSLPVLGMLEQYCGKYLVKSIGYIAKRRPVVAGLSVTLSALIGLGLFLKVHNERPDQYRIYYEEAFEELFRQKQKLCKALSWMREYRNPYLHYEEPLPEFTIPPASVKSESVCTMVSRILDMYIDDINAYQVLYAPMRLINSDDDEND